MQARPNYDAAMRALGAMPTASPMDDAATRARGRAVLDQAIAHHQAAAPRRANRTSARNLVRGKHWEEHVRDETGRMMTERDYLARHGRKAVVMNLTGVGLLNVAGTYRANQSDRQVYPADGGPAGPDGLPYVADDTAREVARSVGAARESFRREASSDEIEADNFFEHGMAGLSAFRSGIVRGAAGYGLGRSAVRDRTVHPNRLFYNLDVADRRMEGLRIVGEVHDVTPSRLLGMVARSTDGPQASALMDGERVLGLYGLTMRDLDPGSRVNPYAGDGFGPNRRLLGILPSQGRTAARFDFGSHDSIGSAGAQAFGIGAGTGTVRVIEAWVEEQEWQIRAVDPLAFNPQTAETATIPGGEGPLPPHLHDEAALHMEQSARAMMGMPPLDVLGWEMAPVWTCWLLTPGGEVIDTFASPYWHGKSPYTVIPALHVDGETWGIVDGAADPQKWLNATLSTLDHNLRTSGRGTSYVDQKTLNDSKLTLSEFEAARVRGDATIALTKGDGVMWDEVLHYEAGAPLPAEAFAMMDRLPAMIDRITGISAAAQGIGSPGVQSGVKFEREVAQANVNIFPFVDSYADGLRRKDLLELRLVQQCIDRPTAFRVARTGEALTVDPAVARALRFDIQTGEGLATAQNKQREEEMRYAEAQAGMITPKTYYQNSTRTDAPAILRAIEEEEAQALLMQQQALAAGIDPATGQPIAVQPPPAGGPAAAPPTP